MRLLDLLPTSGRGVTVAEILDRLGEDSGSTSRAARVKAIQRSLQALVDEGLVERKPGDGRASRYLSSADESGFFIDDRIITSEDALLLLLTLSNLRSVLPIWVTQRLEARRVQAERRLSMELRPGDVGWAGRVRVFPNGYALQAAPIGESVTEAVHRSLRKNTLIQLRVNERGRQRDLKCALLGLLVRPPVTKLVVCESPHAAPFSIMLANVVSAEALEAIAFKPVAFNLDDWIASGGDAEAIGNGQPQALRLRCTHRRAAQWQHHPLGTRQQCFLSDQEGQVEIVADVVDSIELRRYLLSLGSEVQVLSPVFLRDWLLAQASQLTEGRVADQTA